MTSEQTSFEQRVLQRLDRADEFEQQVLQRLSQAEEFDRQFLEKLDALKQEQSLTNVRVDTYQKASGQVVNLAFGLIATAVLAILVNVIVKAT